MRKRPLVLVLLGAVLACVGCHAPASLRSVGSVDHVVVHKRDHTLAVFSSGHLLGTYRVSLGRGGLAPKQREGDNLVPEGTYTVVEHNSNSSFHRALRLSYPTPAQQLLAYQKGTNPGGDIMIHGIRNGLGWIGPLQRRTDWTRGCIALTDPEIDQLFAAVPNGTPVTILP